MCAQYIAKVDEIMALLDRLESRLAAARVAHAEFAAAAVHRVGALDTGDRDTACGAAVGGGGTAAHG